MSHSINPATKIETVVLQDKFGCTEHVQIPVFILAADGSFGSAMRSEEDIEKDIAVVIKRMQEHEDMMSAFLEKRVSAGVSIGEPPCQGCNCHK